MTTTVELKKIYPPRPLRLDGRCPHGASIETCQTAWCRGRLSDETYVVGYEPCNDHKNEPGFGPLTLEGRVERRSKLCLAGHPRYLNGGDGERNPLPPELRPLGVVADASKEGRERLAARLRAARVEGTFGVHVITTTVAGLYRKDPGLSRSAVMHCEQHGRACPVDRCQHTRLHAFTASDRDRVTRRCDQCGTEFRGVRWRSTEASARFRDARTSSSG
jgi:hypothetical protein